MTFTIDTRELNALNVALASAMGQLEWVTARAMTTAAKASRDQIRSQILPMIKGGPTAWTRRGLIVKYATRNDLTAMAGFQYGDGNWTDSAFTPKAGGIPAGRYMGINATGGDRRPKATELQLRRAGIIGANQFITPASGVRLDARGNVSAAQYQQMLSRVRGFTTAGSAQNTTSTTKRRQLDYFVMRTDGAGYAGPRTLGAEPVFIARRIGARGRGFKPAFFITDQPNYERRFPIKQLAMREFNRVFELEFNAGVRRELERRGR